MNKKKIKYYAYKLFPLDVYLKLIYKWYHGKKLDLTAPKAYSEKLFYLKKYNAKPHMINLIRMCYDKYRIREYMGTLHLMDYMPKLYGVYDSADAIDFSKLPERFVMKISQSCGFNYIHNGSNELNEQEVRKQLQEWLDLSKNLKLMTEEYIEENYYFDGSAVIICEEYLVCKDGTPCVDMGVFCFNGEPRFISYDIDAVDASGTRKKKYYRNVYDKNWNLINVDLGREHCKETIVEKPANLDKMLEISRCVSKPFPFARVDLYNRDGDIFLGEITFIPQGASQKISPSKYDDMFGDWLILPEERKG